MPIKLLITAETPLFSSGGAGSGLLKSKNGAQKINVTNPDARTKAKIDNKNDRLSTNFIASNNKAKASNGTIDSACGIMTKNEAILAKKLLG